MSFFKTGMMAVILIIGMHRVLQAYDYDTFTGPNYIHLKESKGDMTQDLKAILKDGPVFLYVSGCGLDKEALPPFQAQSQKLKGVKFLRVSQFAVTKDYLLEQYGSIGAPQLYFIYKGELMSAMPYQYEKVAGQYTFMGWASSIDRWVTSLQEYIPQLKNIPNIYPVSSYNYKRIIKNDNVVLLRADSSQPSFKDAMDTLLQMARQFPEVRFVVDTGIIPYDQEFTTKYQSAYLSFSIVDSDKVIDSQRANPNLGYDRAKLSEWISQYFSKQGPAKTSGVDKDSLDRMFQSSDSHNLSQVDAASFQSLNKRYKIIEKTGLQHSFYIMINAITDSSRNKDMAKVLIEELRYESLGGIQKLVPAQSMREQVYATVIKRAISYERDSEIRSLLFELEQYYRKP